MQTELNLRWAHMFEGSFSDIAAHCLLSDIRIALLQKWPGCLLMVLRTSSLTSVEN